MVEQSRGDKITGKSFSFIFWIHDSAAFVPRQPNLMCVMSMIQQNYKTEMNPGPGEFSKLCFEGYRLEECKRYIKQQEKVC